MRALSWLLLFRRTRTGREEVEPDEGRAWKALEAAGCRDCLPRRMLEAGVLSEMMRRGTRWGDGWNCVVEDLALELEGEVGKQRKCAEVRNRHCIYKKADFRAYRDCCLEKNV
jgi:hypothetical protein